jgi:hypothetical protein
LNNKVVKKKLEWIKNQFSIEPEAKIAVEDAVHRLLITENLA